jgi:hypothetical protein
MQEQDKHNQLGDFGGIPGAPSGPPAVGQASSGSNCTPDCASPEGMPQDSAQKLAFSKYEIHAVANLFPPMGESEYIAFREGIRAIGQTDPIWTWQGKVIDGRHRLRACNELGIEPKFREWDGKGALIEFVVSANLKRRHLKEPQRAMVAAQLAASSRESEAQSLQDKDLGTSASLPSTPTTEGTLTHEQAATLCNVSIRSVVSASRVVRLGATELVTAVQAGKLTIASASDIATLPFDRQRQLLMDGREAIAAAIKSIRDERERLKRAEEGKIPLRPEPSDIEVLDSFRCGQASISKTKRNFRIDLTERWFRELEALSEWRHFEYVLKRGLQITIKEKKESA